jgi:hypothetical protein
LAVSAAREHFTLGLAQSRCTEPRGVTGG